MLSKYVESYKISFKKVLAYRFSMMLSLITGPILIAIQYFVWTAIYSTTGAQTLGGFSQTQMISYYIIITLIAIYLYTPVINDLHRGVREGKFVRFITKPISYPVFKFIETLASRTIATFLEMIPILGIVALLFGTDYFVSQTFFLFILSVIIAFLLNYLVSLMIGCIIFWFKRPNGVNSVYRIINFLLAGALIPLSFFPETIQTVIMLTPFPYLAYIPASIFVGNTTIAGQELTSTTLLLFSSIQLLGLFYITRWVWHTSITKFQGVGT